MRWQSARAAGAIPGSEPALAAALPGETSARVREALFTGITRLASPQGVNALLPLLRTDDAALRTGALDALKILVRKSPEVLPGLLEDADVDVRVLSCELVRALPDPQAVPLLSALLQREQDGNVASAAVDVLAEVGQRDALPALATAAARFAGIPYLAFAIRMAIDSISGPAPPPRG